MKYFVILALVLFSAFAVAGKKAVTEDGDVVILNDDGTWVYESAIPQSEAELKMNPGTFSKPDNASFKIKSGKTDANFWINPKKWKFEKNLDGNAPSEYTFQLKGEDLYAMAITERLAMNLDSLADQALENAKDAAPDTRILKKEYRMVNGNKVIYLEMEGTIQGVKFRYLGYYHSNDAGVTQYLTYTGANLVKDYQEEIDNFLNGFMVAK